MKRAELQHKRTASHWRQSSYFDSVPDPLNEILDRYTKDVARQTDELLKEIFNERGLVLTDVLYDLKKTCSRAYPPSVNRYWYGDECILEVTQTFEDNILKAVWNIGV